jgi:hypothetical protein
MIRTRTVERIPQTSSGGSAKVLEMSIRPAIHAVGAAFASAPPSTASSSPLHTTFQHRRHTSPGASSISSLDGSSSLDWQLDAPTSSGRSNFIHTTRVPWPLSDPIEAHLFRIFVDTFAPQWDTTNANNVFEKIVPQMALTNSMLLNAVFMIASQIVCRTDASFPVKPFLYHERVLQGLIPYLADHGRIQDEATLVAAMLLRGFEEFHGEESFDSTKSPFCLHRIAGTRGQYHLSTYELFHGPDGWLFNMSSPVIQACYMVHVHFEINQSLLDRPSLRIDYRHFTLSALALPMDDAAWGNRIVWICARILQWAQADSHLLTEWQMLKDIVDEWEQERPSSFNAFFYQEANTTEGGHFPELWFPGICHGESNSCTWVLVRLTAA